jgi:adenine/guanine phosphoribosyltransferase-like PRPP-binding protein
MDVVTERSQTRPPYQAYAAIMGVYAGGLALAAAAARLLGRDPRDLVQLGLRVHDLGEACSADRS